MPCAEMEKLNYKTDFILNRKPWTTLAKFYCKQHKLKTLLRNDVKFKKLTAFMQSMGLRYYLANQDTFAQHLITPTVLNGEFEVSEILTHRDTKMVRDCTVWNVMVTWEPEESFGQSQTFLNEYKETL